tara:strand:+ start:41 stop:577 length:537 start_codon:yes stop_codon:yes gene_type:complete
MIENFKEYFAGTYNNGNQAFARPLLWSAIHLIHKQIDDNWFYGEQQNILQEKPYRQFVIEVIESGDKIITKNYKLDNEKHYHLRNMDSIFDSLTYVKNCDRIFTFEDGKYISKMTSCDCIVEWEGQKTYVENSSILSESEYHIYDKGYSVDTDEYVWGSRHGHYEFLKTHKEPLLIGD